MKSGDFVDTLNAWVYVPDSYPILFPMEGVPDDGIPGGDEPGKPSITEGKNSSWVLGSANGLTFTSDGNIQDFIHITIDGQVIDGSQYVKAEGRMTVTLSAAFLGTLTVGEHYIDINFNNGKASTTFTIKQTAAEPETASKNPSDSQKPVLSGNPKTGDRSNMAIYSVAAWFGWCSILVWSERETQGTNQSITVFSYDWNKSTEGQIIKK